MKTKKCKTCGEDLSVDLFSKRKDARDGLVFSCKECVRKKYYMLKGKPTPEKKVISPEAEDGFKYCAMCREKFPSTSEYFPKDDSMRLGLHSYCRKCMVKRGRSIRTKNLSDGVCYHCRKPRLENSSHLCLDCWIKATSIRRLNKSYKKELKLLLEEQDYKCPYTGDTLICGSNTSLDHTQCASKNRDKEKSLENMSWVSFWANMAKSDLTIKEFYENCKKVVNMYERNGGFKIKHYDKVTNTIVENLVK